MPVRPGFVATVKYFGRYKATNACCAPGKTGGDRVAEDFTSSVRLSAERRAFHRRELARLRELASTATTKAVKARVLRQVQEHALFVGLSQEGDAAE